jgi:hypothetical protein
MLAMPTFHTLRHARALAHVVLAWFVLSVGVAIAAPVVQPQSLILVCSVGGEVKLLSIGDDSSVVPAGHSLDCVLCLSLNAPPPSLVNLIDPRPITTSVEPVVIAARNAWRTASPLPARGPPLSL